MSLQGKNALITGSSRGIGRGIALALAAQGCNVAINFYRKRQLAEETAKAAAACGVQVALIRANLSRETEMQRLVQDAAAELGGLDIFVANAASGVMKPLMEIDAKAWDWTLNINARSALVGAQTAAPYMRAQGWGRIVSITSIGSQRVFRRYGIVGISKAALEALTRYLAVELAPDGIIANCISPGLVVTDALDFFPQKAEMLNHAQQHTPARRLVTPEDVGNLVVWLCSEEARMIVGQTIAIDGGYGLLMD